MSKRRATSSRPKPLFVDTSGFVALVSASDGNHRAADAIFRDVIRAKRGLITTHLVLAEMHRLILFRAGVRAARATLGRLDASAALHVHTLEDTDHASALEWLDRLSDQRITYADAASFAVMTRLGCRRVISFDHDFVIPGFELVQPPRHRR